MTKAYDKVSHKILLTKLYDIGIRGKAHGWFKSYLNNRKQYVEIEYYNNETREIGTMKSGTRCTNWSIPQGSVTGCILFIIYINELPNIINSPCILFADDVSLIFKCDNDNESINNIIQSFETVKNWLLSHNLEINLKKTKLIQFRPTKQYNMT